MTPRHLLLVVADGIRPEVLAEEIDAGHAPALAALRARGGLHAVSTVFPCSGTSSFSRVDIR